MRKRGVSPWLIAEQQRQKTSVPMGVAHRIADGDHPLRVWREEATVTVGKLARMTRIDFDRLINLETGRAFATEDELGRIATALNVAVHLIADGLADSIRNE